MNCNYSTCKRGCTTICAAENAYHPSNGTEGMGFMEAFCDQCLHQNPDPDPKYSKPKNCEIHMLTMLYYPNQPEYPKEWCYRDGKPVCTKFVKWDWNNDGDPDDPDNPKAPPPPPDPNQIDLFPLYPNESTYAPDKKELPILNHGNLQLRSQLQANTSGCKNGGNLSCFHSGA